MKLSQYLKKNTLRPGTRIELRKKDGSTIMLWIGDATPYIGPTTLDGGIGWDYDDETCQCELIRIDDFADLDWVKVGLD
jgi:hypothetical protein